MPRALKENVHFDVTSFQSKNENILVVGGGDSASEFAQYLIEMGHEVTLSYRQKNFSRMNSFNINALNKLEENGQIELLLESNIEEVKISQNECPLVCFKESHLGEHEYARIIYALGGSTPTNFLKSIGIKFENETPRLRECGETTIAGLYVTGDLLAGKRGGSIAQAFNASKTTMEKICHNYLECEIS